MPEVTARPVPDAEAIELADYKLGSFGSDLEVFRSQLEEACGDDVKTIDDVKAYRVTADVDPDHAARIVVAATDWLHYLELRRLDVETIRNRALELYQNATARVAPEHYQRLANWHRDRLSQIEEREA